MNEGLIGFGTLVLGVGWLLLFVAWGRKLADNRGHSKAMGGWVAGIFGILGIAVLAIMGTNHEERDARIRDRLAALDGDGGVPQLRYWVIGLIVAGFAMMVIGSAQEPASAGPASSAPAGFNPRTPTPRAAATPRVTPRAATPRATPNADAEAIAMWNWARGEIVTGCTQSGNTSTAVCGCMADYIMVRMNDDDWDQILDGRVSPHADTLAIASALACAE